MQVATAQILGADFLTRRGLHQWRASKENCTLIADNHTFVAHSGHISPARGAAAHHARDLRDTLCAHICLIEENTAKMVTIRKDLVLMW